MNYSILNPNDVSNGEGIRTSLFVSGCEHKCKECFNQETWSFDYGEEFTEETLSWIFHYLKSTYISGLTILGGEPLHPKNIDTIIWILESIKDKFKESKDIWIYTGYTYEELGILYGNKKFKKLLKNIDVLVDGRFIISQKNLNLKFRGSNNQRLIDVKQTIIQNKIVLVEE